MTESRGLPTTPREVTQDKGMKACHSPVPKIAGAAYPP